MEARTYYTYRVTASDSDKYYFGVSSIRKASGTFEECEAHPYFGSGGGPGSKFYSWKKNHRDFLEKEVLALYPTKEEAYKAEKELVGDLWKADPLCLNSVAGGGAYEPHRSVKIGVRECPIHGLVKHIGKNCYSCSNNKVEVLLCPTHGEAKHRGGRCLRCSREKNTTKKKCSIHGVTFFYGGQCCKCHNQALTTMTICPVHGKTYHLGATCTKCRTNSMAIELCSTHGAVKHSKGKCVTCKNEKMISLKPCPTHGEVKHRGPSCLSCSAEKSFTLEECPRHGLKKHSKLGKCASCRSEKIAHNRFHKNEKKSGCLYC